MEFILFVLFAFILFASLIAYAIYSIWVERKEKLAIREQIDYLAKNALEPSPQEFFEIRNKKVKMYILDLFIYLCIAWVLKMC